MREDIDQSGLSPEGTWYDLRGSGSPEAPVVMIHGVGLDHTMWEPQMPALEEAFCVLRYDMLGHGRSEARPVKDITTFVRQLEDLLSYLDITKMHLVGLSMGGVISQAFAGSAPSRLKTLVLMNTVYRRTEEELIGMRHRLQLTREEGLAPIAQAAMDRWFDAPFKAQFPDRVEAIRRKLLANDLKAYADAYAAL
ncbi:MAG: alpha/beta fold hydrolase, partial [Arenicellales bacterium]